MTTDPKPMDPERLAQLRDLVASFPVGADGGFLVAEMLALLADRDGQERGRKVAEADRDFLARLTGSAICRATCIAPGEVVIERDPAIAEDALTGAVERLRSRAEQAERDRDDQERRAQKNRSDYTRAHGLLCDLNRRLSAAVLPGERAPDWDAIVTAAEKSAVKAGLHDDAVKMLSRDFGLDGDATRRHAVDAALVAAVRYRTRADDHQRHVELLGRIEADLRQALTEARARAEQADRERDEARAELARLRARVRVEAGDVERAGVTRVQVEAWLRANGWAPPKRDHYGWTVVRAPNGHEADLWRTDGSTPLDHTVCFIADDIQRPGLDILDEMAAMPLDPQP